MKILLSLTLLLLALALAGCKPPPMEFGFAVTDSTVCLGVHPDVGLDDVSVTYEGGWIWICYETPKPPRGRDDPRRR